MINDFSSMNPYLLTALIVWSLAWKGVALWKAARNESKPWFIALLIINTVGILPILYIFIFSKSGNKGEVAPSPVTPETKAVETPNLQ
jgi:hypothetical protein